MSQPKSRLAHWRRRLKNEAKNLIHNSAIDELCETAKQQVQFYFRTPRRLSPTALSRELEQMSKGLARAAKAIEAIGAQGMTHLYAASRANSDLDEFAPQRHAAYILEMSRWAKRAAMTARDEKLAGGAKRGPTVDLNLRSLVIVLADQYWRILALRPTHTAHKKTGAGTSLFDEFVKAAFSDFSPTRPDISWKQIDEAIGYAIGLFKEFTTFSISPEQKARNSGFRR